MLKWMDKVDWIWIVLAVYMAVAPIVPEPHLYEKIKMLFAGTLSKPVDIFDLLMHGSFALIVILKVLREITKPRNDGKSEA